MPEEPAYQEGEFEHAPSHSAGSSSDLYSSRAEDEPAAASYAGSELVSGFSGLLSSCEHWGARATSLSAFKKGCGPLSPCTGTRTTVSIILCRLTGTIGHPHSLGAREAERMLWESSSGGPPDFKTGGDQLHPVCIRVPMRKLLSAAISSLRSCKIQQRE